MAKTTEKNISKADYPALRGYLLRWTGEKADGSRGPCTELFSLSKYGSWAKAFAAAKKRKQDLTKAGRLGPLSKPAPSLIRPPRAKPPVTPTFEDPAVEALIGILNHAETAGLRTLSQLKAFLLFARYEGSAQVQLGDSGVFESSTAVREYYKQLGPGKKGVGRRGEPALVMTGRGGEVTGSALGNEHLAKPVKLTAAGRRLLRKVVS